MGVIAAQLDHSDTRMTEKHYAHLSPSYVADTVRMAFGDLGIVPETVVTPMRRGTSVTQHPATASEESAASVAA